MAKRLFNDDESCNEVGIQYSLAAELFAKDILKRAKEEDVFFWDVVILVQSKISLEASRSIIGRRRMVRDTPEPNKKVIVQNWMERDSWSGPSADGFTIHLDMNSRIKYVEWFHSKFNNLQSAPESYTTTDGDPIEVEVSADLYGKISEHFNNLVVKDVENLHSKCVHGIGRCLGKRKELKEGDISF